MSDSVIKVEELSKKFILSHETPVRYTALREVIVKKALALVNANKKDIGAREEFYALRDVSFEINQGDRVGIVGRNGAGKSTLLKILSRITEPTSGRITIKGRVASLLEVGTGFHPELTGRENIFLNGAILGMSRAEIKKKFDEIVDFAGIEKFLDTPVKRYSSGMYVRLAFAVAAHLEPEILIVDEVLSVGDIEFQKKCLGKMEEVSAKNGRTVLLVSHNVTAIKALCMKGCYLKNGRINLFGDVSQCVSEYLKQATTITFENELEKKIASLPHDEIFKLFSIRMEQPGKKYGFEFFVEDDILINISYKVFKKILGLRIGFDIIEKDSDTIVFRSFHDDLNDDLNVAEPGEYTSTMTIPAHLFKQGVYIFRFITGIHNNRWILFDEIQIEINTINVEGINRIYADLRPGIILPFVQWKTKKN